MAVEFNNHATCAWIAHHYGWFEDEGLNLTCFEAYVTGTALASAVARGDIQAAYMCLGPALLLYSRGVPIKIVAGLHLYGFAIVAKPEIVSITDLDGKVVGVVAEGSQADLLLRFTVDKYNLKNVDIRRMNPPMALTALIAGKIDAACIPEFFATLAEVQGFHMVARSQDLWPNMQGSVLVVKEDLIKEHPEVVKKLVSLVVRGTNFIHDQPDLAASVLTDELKGAKVLGVSQEVLDILGSQMELVTADLLKRSMNNLEYSYEIDINVVQNCIDFMAKLEYVEQFNASDILDLSFLWG
ncbi:MAG: ABC transporter substrate-binding protein [Candidatus Bathyarchaeia archaeon]